MDPITTETPENVIVIRNWLRLGLPVQFRSTIRREDRWYELQLPVATAIQNEIIRNAYPLLEFRIQPHEP